MISTDDYRRSSDCDFGIAQIDRLLIEPAMSARTHPALDSPWQFAGWPDAVIDNGDRPSGRSLTLNSGKMTSFDN